MTASVGTSVLTVEATDDDSGNFEVVRIHDIIRGCGILLFASSAQIRYSIVGTLNGRFRIDEETGVILTRGSFDNLDGQKLTLTVGRPISLSQLYSPPPTRCWPQTILAALPPSPAQPQCSWWSSTTSRESVSSSAVASRPFSSQRTTSSGDTLVSTFSLMMFHCPHIAGSLPISRDWTFKWRTMLITLMTSGERRRPGHALTAVFCPQIQLYLPLN